MTIDTNQCFKSFHQVKWCIHWSDFNQIKTASSDFTWAIRNFIARNPVRYELIGLAYVIERRGIEFILCLWHRIYFDILNLYYRCPARIQTFTKDKDIKFIELNHNHK